MAASTVLRVKRRLEDNPQDALVLMCKRMKTDTEEISPSLFVYRGTVKNQEPAHVRSIVPKTDLKLQFTSNVQDIIQKLRKERKAQSSESRYEVVNCCRGLNCEVDNQIDLVDLQKADQKNAEDYAYDLYTSARQDFDVSMLDKLVSIENYETDLILGTNRNDDSTDEGDDDDDSNDENNWRNDYPDSEHSINEEDMVRAMERVDLDNDLSSDDDVDIYEQATDDVTRYGAAYARYKAKVMADNPDLNDSKGLVLSSKGKDLDEESVDERDVTLITLLTGLSLKGLVLSSKGKDLDEESVDGYKDDSDDGFYYGQDEDKHSDLYNSDSDSDVYTPD